MTEFRQAARLHQARWREAHGHPIGTQPIVPRPGKPVRPVGSRMPYDYAVETGANFVTSAALAAARARSAAKEPRQSWDNQRLWADLLWSPALAFNLFGDLQSWPDGPVREVRFMHSPGRLDPTWLGTLVDLHAALLIDDGIVGISVAYHERSKRELPKPERLPRYLEVAERAGVSTPALADALGGSDLLVIGLQHLLVLAMVQNGDVAWGRLVVVHPEGNVDYVDMCRRYGEALAEDSTFASMTLESLLDSGAVPRRSAAALRRRYVVAS